MKKAIIFCACALTSVVMAQVSVQSGGGHVIQYQSGGGNKQSISISNENIVIENSGSKLEINSADVVNVDNISKNNCTQRDEIVSSDCAKTVFSRPQTRIMVSAANLEGSHFRNTIIEHSSFGDTDMSEALFTNSKIFSSHFINVDLESTRLHHMSIHKTDFLNSDFSDATLSDVVFENSTFSNVDFSHATLTNVRFVNSQLLPFMLSDAILINVTLPNGVVCLSNADCQELLE